MRPSSHPRLAVLAILVSALAAATLPAAAFTLRSPQVALVRAPLQAVLDSTGGGINVLTDQLDAPEFSGASLPSFDYVAYLLRSDGSSIGLYDTQAAGTPTPFMVFPPVPSAGWVAALHFTRFGQLSVALYDQDFVFQGVTVYPGFDVRHFGFYVQGPQGIGYQQDARNGGRPQVLMYAGTGSRTDEWFECFESAPYDPATSTFAGSVVNLAPVLSTPVRVQSWGRLKALYR